MKYIYIFSYVIHGYWIWYEYNNVLCQFLFVYLRVENNLRINIYHALDYMSSTVCVL